jgi:hypothetical protein
MLLEKVLLHAIAQQSQTTKLPVGHIVFWLQASLC